MRWSSRSKHLADANVFERKPSEAMAEGGLLTALKKFGLNLWGSYGVMQRAGEMGVGEIDLYEAVLGDFPLSSGLEWAR
jgi:hypothetical protein